MSPEPTPKKPQKKDDEYMRKAYIYSAILLILGLIGGGLLAERIVTAEARQEAAQAEQEVEDEGQPTDGDQRAEP